MFASSRYVDGNTRLFELGFGHLRGYSSFPNQVVQLFFLLRSVYLGDVHIGWANGLVRLLRPLCARVEVARQAILLAPQAGNFFLRGIDAKAR